MLAGRTDRLAQVIDGGNTEEINEEVAVAGGCVHAEPSDHGMLGSTLR